jgi:branched-chain amino acid transport system permease protein
MLKVTRYSRLLIFLFLFAILVITPPFLKPYYIFLLNYIFIYIILAVGLNLVMGYTGQISLGNAAFFGIGAYGSALLSTKMGIPFLLCIPLGGVISGFFGFIVGLPALRMSGLYLAMVTLGFGELIQLVFFQWDKLTRGPDGIVIPKPKLGSFEFSNDYRVYYLILIAVLLLLLITRNVIRSRTGRAFLSIRESETAAQMLGVNLAYYKILAFVLSAFFAGIAGGLYGAFVHYISPDSFSVLESILHLSMVIIGGLGTIMGPIIGGVVLTILLEVLKGLRSVQEVIYGVLLVVFIIFMPQGIWGMIKGRYVD